MIEHLTRMQERLNASPHLQRLGQLFSETVLLSIGGQQYFLEFERGALLEITPGPSRRTPYRFGILTDAAALDAFWQPVPAPGFHDLFGLVKLGRAEITGDILMLVKNLRFFKEFLALGRTPKEAVA